MFCPLNSRKIKQSRASEWSDQGRFSPIKILYRGRKRFYERCICDYPLLYNAFLYEYVEDVEC